MPIRDTHTVTLNVNGAQAKQMMSDIEAKIKSTETTIKSLKANMADPKDIEKAKKQLRTYQKQLSEMQSQTEGVNKTFENLGSATPRQLEKTLKALNRQLKDMTPGTEVWSSHVEKIKEVKERLAEVREELTPQQSMWEKFKNWLSSSGVAIGAVALGVDQAISTLRGYVDAFAEMDQEMANVRKFTGMTADQVDALNQEFKKLDTRTSREDLNKLAQEAGRLGKTSAEDVLGFVRAADKINVALDDLGEGATLTLSKLTGIFGDEARYGTEQSLLKVGSVINELSQNCSASAPYLAQFASRMGGVGSQAKMTIPQIMGLGAVLDSNAQAVEASSTALSQVIVRMMQEPAKYAKVAGLDVQKFTETLKSDTNGALIMFLETLQKAGGMDVLSPMFKDMGENGSRAIAALSTLATHIDDVKAQQLAANKAFQEGTSVNKEFDVQNNTVQASLEKCKNAAHEMQVELGARLQPVMGHLLTSGAAIMRTLLSVIKFVIENKGAVISLALAIAAYNIAVNLAAIKTAFLTTVTKAYNLVLATQRLAMLAAASVVALLQGNVTRATAAFKMFSNAIKANPIGLAVSLITGAVAAIGAWISKVNEAKKAEEELARQRAQQAREFRKQITDTSKTAGDYAQAELDRLKKLYNATQDQTKSQKERIAAVKELQKTYPSAFGNLSQETILAGGAASAYNKLAKSIINAARAKAAAEKIKENEKLLLDLEAEQEDLQDSITRDSEDLDRAEQLKKSVAKRNRNKYMLSFSGPSKADAKRYEDAAAAVDNLNDNLDANSEKLEINIMKQGELHKTNEWLAKRAEQAESVPDDINLSAGPLTSAPTGGGGTGYVSQVQAEKDRKKAEAERRKAEAEARRAEAKEKKEFKDTLNSYKAHRSAADKEALNDYEKLSIDYNGLLNRRYENEMKYYNDSITYFEETFKDQEDTYLQDDKDYKKLLLDKEKATEKYNAEIDALELKNLERKKRLDEQKAQMEYESKSDPSLEDEVNLQAKLFAIQKEFLQKKLEFYNAGSKEYADIQFQIEELEQSKELTMKKLYMKAYKEYRQQFEQESAAERYKKEKAVIDALLKANLISLEEHAKWLKALAEKYKAELPGTDPDSSSWSTADQAKYDADVAALQAALNAKLISEREYYGRIANLDKASREKQLAGLKATGGEWNAMLVDVGNSVADLVQRISTGGDGVLDSLTDTVGTVSAAVTAGMQIANQFAQAEAQIKTAALEKHYSREIELAQGNSYKVAKLEKKKEKEIAKIKSDASKKQFAMQVIQAIAQTATNALNAYGSALQIGGMAGLILAPIAAAVATAQGMVQVALLKKQQQASEAQGYSKGGFTRPGRVDEPAGIVHAGEWVASQKLLSNPVARPMIDALDYAQRTNTIGSLRAEDVSRSIRANDALARSADNGEPAALMTAAAAEMARTVDALKSRLDEPFVTVNTVTGDRGIKQAQDEYSRLMNNITPKSKRR
jgi:TP901 family phage tail tape measure protein